MLSNDLLLASAGSPTAGPEDCIPDLTSNTSHIVTDGIAFGHAEAWKVFDANQYDTYLFNSPNAGEFVGFQFNEPRVIDKFQYSLHGGDDTCVFEASNDGVNYVQLWSGVSTPAAPWIDVSNSSAYTYYRLRMVTVVNQTHFYDMQMNETIPTTYYVPNNNLISAFETTTNGAYDNTRGYYFNGSGWGVDSYRIMVPPGDIAQVTVNATGYYNTPSGCIGNNIVRLTYTDATTVDLGTSDAWTYDWQGQKFYGDEGAFTDHTEFVTDVINWQLTLHVPIDKTVDYITLHSHKHPDYAASNRGMKDIIIDYR